MSARFSLRSIRAQAARGRSRAGERGAKRRSSRRRKRTLVIGGTLVAGFLAGFVVANSEPFQEALREVTLPLRHDDIIRQQAKEKGVDAELIAAVIYAESRFRDQTSHAGARGLMQITPATAKYIERKSGGQTFRQEDLADPDINIRYGTFYLRHLLAKFDDNEVAALAAYNAGESRVDAWGGEDLERDDIEIDETRAYVDDVLEKRDDYRRHYGEELGLE